MACLCKCCEATQNVEVQTAGVIQGGPKVGILYTIYLRLAHLVFNLFILMPDEGSHVHAVLACAGADIQLHLFVTSALGEGEWYLHALAAIP